MFANAVLLVHLTPLQLEGLHHSSHSKCYHSCNGGCALGVTLLLEHFFRLPPSRVFVSSRILRLHIDECLSPDSGVTATSTQQLCADGLVPVVSSFFIEASTGVRPLSHVQEILIRTVYEPETTLSSSVPFMTSLCQSLHFLACERWCDEEGLTASDEKAPHVLVTCHEVRQTLLKSCLNASHHSRGAHVSAYWCQVALTL